ncbi:CheR family methyltransferase [Phenylobacterium immobile]|uniref:CheR family methyltransferase n=1 Tax=Phenylobacterium immobile TaxID=21 RepID=UPI001FE10716|nr:protein-glutamate O-methyltransferase CheR [Phenylobacterium immobile]
MRRSEAAPPPPDALETLKRQVISRTGHFYYADKDDLLWERARRRMRATGETTLPGYLRRLETEPGEWAALEAEITIGETFFFRYAEQFEALRETILPEIFGRRAGEKRVRILSAGCATGAEPYSLAILIDQMLGEARADWRVSILGVDINETFLAAARRAEYGRWATRTLTDGEREAWFTPGPGPEKWSLKRKHRIAARFQYLNLMDLLSPAPPLELTDYDLILCRNVLIYFHPDTVLAIAQALTERLTPEGWLLVGHAEPNSGFDRFAQATHLPHVTAYRPLTAPQIEAIEQAPAPSDVFHGLAEKAVAWEPAAPIAPMPGRPTAPAAAAPAAAEPPSHEGVAQIRARADLGDLEGALKATAAALKAAPDDPVLRYYEGVLSKGLDLPDAAEAALRKTLYLDDGFALAHMQLGLLRIERGQLAAGRRSLATAARLSGTFPADAPLPEGAGMTAQDLRDIARLYLDRDGGL